MNKEQEMVRIACKAIDDKKAIDIKVIDIHEVSVIADYFIIASGNNLNQVQAIVDNVEEQLGRAGDILQTGDHPQGGGLAAAGGAHQHDELLVRDLQTELLDGHYALLGDLEAALFLRRLLALLGLFLLLGVGVDLLQILQNHLCHTT